MVQVDEYPVLCGKLNCNFVYSEQASEITAFTVTGQSVSITGTSLPSELVSVSLGRLPCAVVSNSETQITCDLDYPVPAGSWIPIVRDEFGLIKVADTVTYLEVAIIVTSIEPKTDLNPAGGNIITITGQNFPATLESAEDLTIVLGGTTGCELLSVSPTEITCRTEAFSTSSRRRLQLALETFDLSLTLATDANNVVYTDSGFDLNASPLQTVSITPSQISPIAFTTIEIGLDATYPTAGMTKEDFSVTLVPITLELTYLTINNGGVRPLNVIAVDSEARTITVKYGGAYSGTYNIQIASQINGRIDSINTPLLVVFEVNSISPT